MKQQVEEKKRKLRVAGKPVIVDEDNPIYLKKAIAIMIMKLFADLERKRMGHEDKVQWRNISPVSQVLLIMMLTGIARSPEEKGWWRWSTDEERNEGNMGQELGRVTPGQVEQKIKQKFCQHTYFFQGWLLDDVQG